MTNKVIKTNNHEISGRTIISRILHSHAPNLVGMNGDVQSDLATLAFKNGQQLEYFHRRILGLKQEIILSVETLSPTRLLFQYTKSLPKIEKLKYFIAPKMIYIITFLDNNGESAVYTGVNIHGLYHYLQLNLSPNTLTTSVQFSCNFDASSSIKNDTATLQPVIAYIPIRKNIICKFCGRIGQKDDACIIRGPKLSPPSIRRNTKQFNALHGDEPTGPLR